MTTYGWGNIVFGSMLEIVGLYLSVYGGGIIMLLGLILDVIGLFLILKGLQPQSPEERAATAYANAPADRPPRVEAAVRVATAVSSFPEGTGAGAGLLAFGVAGTHSVNGRPSTASGTSSSPAVGVLAATTGSGPATDPGVCSDLRWLTEVAARQPGPMVLADAGLYHCAVVGVNSPGAGCWTVGLDLRGPPPEIYKRPSAVAFTGDDHGRPARDRGAA